MVKVVTTLALSGYGCDVLLGSDDAATGDLAVDVGLSPQDSGPIVQEECSNVPEESDVRLYPSAGMWDEATPVYSIRVVNVVDGITGQSSCIRSHGQMDAVFGPPDAEAGTGTVRAIFAQCGIKIEIKSFHSVTAPAGCSAPSLAFDPAAQDYLLTYNPFANPGCAEAVLGKNLRFDFHEHTDSGGTRALGVSSARPGKLLSLLLADDPCGQMATLVLHRSFGASGVVGGASPAYGYALGSTQSLTGGLSTLASHFASLLAERLGVLLPEGNSQDSLEFDALQCGQMRSLISSARSQLENAGRLSIGEIYRHGNNSLNAPGSTPAPPVTFFNGDDEVYSSFRCGFHEIPALACGEELELYCEDLWCYAGLARHRLRDAFGADLANNDSTFDRLLCTSVTEQLDVFPGLTLSSAGLPSIYLPPSAQFDPGELGLPDSFQGYCSGQTECHGKRQTDCAAGGCYVP